MGTFSKPASEWVSTDLVQQHILSAASWVGVEARLAFAAEMQQRMEMNADVALEPLSFDSPLEASFWTWWHAYRRVDHFVREDVSLCRHIDITEGGQRYVLDFALAPTERFRRRFPDTENIFIGIELDGHAFHEKTREQVTWRNRRDRTLQIGGWQIFHFSYAEFTAAPDTCVGEVVEYLRAVFGKIAADHWERRRQAEPSVAP